MPFQSQHPRGRGRFPFFLLVAGAAVLALGALVMGLWNAILPAAVHAGRLSYWQGVGLLVLCRVLFGSFGFGRGPGWARRARGNWPQEKWLRLSEEERQRLRQRWQERGRRHSWPPGMGGSPPQP